MTELPEHAAKALAAKITVQHALETGRLTVDLGHAVLTAEYLALGADAHTAGDDGTATWLVNAATEEARAFRLEIDVARAGDVPDTPEELLDQSEERTEEEPGDR